MLNDREKQIIKDYVGPKDRACLEEVIEKYKENINGKLYRGARVPAEEIKVGSLFPYWDNYSSWSKNLNIAVGFAKDEYIPEETLGKISKKVLNEKDIEILEEDKDKHFRENDNESYLRIYEKKVDNGLITWDEVYDRVLNVLFILEDNCIGLDINKIYKENPYIHEEEMLVDTSNKKIVSIDKSDDYLIVKIA
ncbi:MAG: hypothetical protein K0R54_1844 [Clostridiaceae bacterium]|jgi:hypothetical protein|nr:hypothetical protein [Clostridiaceae bacterium]